MLEVRLLIKFSWEAKHEEGGPSLWGRPETQCVIRRFRGSTYEQGRPLWRAKANHPGQNYRIHANRRHRLTFLQHSGDTPSKEDRAVTNRLEESGKTLGVDVLDHIIVAREGVRSIRDM